jgi:hypothetical protein
MYLAPFYDKYINSLTREQSKLKKVEIVHVKDTLEYFSKYSGEDPKKRHWKWQGLVPDKDDLCLEFENLQDASKVEDLAIRNHVRDAWKADTAIKYNAVFLTCDHNALIYHKWICSQEGVDRPAIAMFLHDDAFTVKT